MLSRGQNEAQETPKARDPRITDEWRLMSLVIDRICLIIYFVLNVVAILSFFLQAQFLFDTREPLQRTIAQKPLSGGAINVFAN
ncbi:unnamed protein product [Anisakis simplex]|uniref:RDD family protein n=1 Tax=Anisakis simplex TaxID=6269 RepID=A0A0M3JTK6_ANISI|nr:unnamed protein product [Anisakis simplex]